MFRSFTLAIIIALAPIAAHAQGSGNSALEGIFGEALDDLLGRDRDRSGEVERRVPGDGEALMLSYAPIVREVAPSVVNVYAARRVRQRSPFEGDPFFERFFGGNSPFGQPRERVQSSLGSGVIVTSDGIIITNHHVIKDATEVKIALNDGSEYDCEIILNDEKSDLAVLKVSGGGEFAALEVADSDAVAVGDIVLAIGNPFGVGQTVTSGIVSAVARSRVGINDFDFFIQTDAAINPGNSGGALVDMKGRLVGINTAIYSRSGGSIGIGFAIPSNMVSAVIRSAVSGDDTLERPWIGATFQDVTPDIARSLGMRRPGGVLVGDLYPGGPAERAGLRPGDVVIGINERIIENMDALGYRLDTIGIGGEVELVVISDRRRKLVNLTLEPAPETVPRNETRLDDATVLGGATVANLSPAVAQELGVPSSRKGIVVTDVDQPSRAAQNGVRPGDIVLAVNGVETSDVSDLVSVISRQSRRGWQVVLRRQGKDFVFERNGAFFRQYLR